MLASRHVRSGCLGTRVTPQHLVPSILLYLIFVLSYFCLFFVVLLLFVFVCFLLCGAGLSAGVLNLERYSCPLSKAHIELDAANRAMLTPVQPHPPFLRAPRSVGSSLHACE